MKLSKHPQARGDAREHRWAEQMLPWLANDTLGEPERARLQRHLERCAACRAGLERERRLAAQLAQQVVVPHSPQPGFARLLQRIDAAPARTAPARWRRLFARSAVSARGSAARPWYAVALAAQAAALLVLALTTAWLALAPERAPEYRTLSQGDPATAGAQLQVVFADSVTAAEMQRLLEQVGGRIVSGPSPAGLVQVALAPGAAAADPAAAARWLSQQPGVAFAAAVQGAGAP